MHRTSPFIDIASVEAWDSWFRWRERGHLRDLDVEATWRRVVAALSPRRGQPAAAADLFEACASWRLLLDERILATAGTPEACWPADGLVALLNVPVFVRGRFGAQAALDLASLAQTARLAVAALDSAVDAGKSEDNAPRRLRIGLTGMADALALLGIGYDSDAARRQAADVARTLAQACLETGVKLACDRGAAPACSTASLEQARSRGVPSDLMRDLARYGLRYAALTAITSQPRLALLANNVSDALDPLLGERPLRVGAHAATARPAVSGGYAHSLRRSLSMPATTAFTTLADLPLDAQLTMRAAVQPWIDAPIVYPLSVRSVPGVQEWEAIRASAMRQHLADPAWRPVGEERECVA